MFSWNDNDHALPVHHRSILKLPTPNPPDGSVLALLRAAGRKDNLWIYARLGAASMYISIGGQAQTKLRSP